MTDADGILDQSGRFRYSIQADGTAAIVRCLERKPDLRIPEALDGRKVTALLENSIVNNEVQTVFIPGTVSEIEDAAFVSEWIREVLVDGNNPRFRIVDGILMDTAECSIVFCPPESPVSFVTVPSWICSVRDFAFSCCVNLKQIIFPEGLEYIGYEAFEHCTELTDVCIPSAVRLGDWAFDDCPKLTVRYIQ